MPWFELPLRIEVAHDGTVPLTLFGDDDALTTFDEAATYLHLPMIPGDGTTYDADVSWRTGTFDPSPLIAAVAGATIVIDQVTLRFQNRGSGALSYPGVGVYSGTLLTDADGDPTERLPDMDHRQLERTTTAWITSENSEDNPLAVRFDVDFTGNLGTTDASIMTTAKILAGTVRGILYNDFGASSSQDVSYAALRVHFLYAGPWIQPADFYAYQGGTNFPDEWQPTKAVLIDRQWTQLHDPSTGSGVSTSDPDARADAWDHIVVGQSGTTFWDPADPAAVVDGTDSSYLDNSTTSNDGSKARARYAYDYDPPTGLIGDTTDWDRRDVAFLQRPDDGLWVQTPTPDQPADAADIESERDYADPDDGYGEHRFFNYLTRVDWKLDQTFRSPLDDGEPSPTGEQFGWIYPKLWTHDQNGLGPFTGTGNESLGGAFFPYHHTAIGTVSTVGTPFEVDKDGVPILSGSPKLFMLAEDVGFSPGFEYPFNHYPEPAPDSQTADDYEPKWHATFVFASARTVEPDTSSSDDQEDALVPTGSWSERTASIRMVVKWTMRPVRHRFLYESPPYEPHPLRQRQIGWLAQRQRHRRPGIVRQSRW